MFFSLRQIPPRASTKTKAITEYRKAPFNCFSATANRKKQEKLMASSNVPFLSSTTANRKGAYFFFRLRRIRKNVLQFRFSDSGEKKNAQRKKPGCGKKCCTPKIAYCAMRNQPRGGCCAKRLFRPKCCSRATAQQPINALVRTTRYIHVGTKKHTIFYVCM